MNIEMVRLFDLYAPLLSERQREIMSLHYNEDESLGEIAENIGITRQGVRDCIVKSESFLASCEQSLGLRRKTEKLEEAVQGLADEVERNGNAELAVRIKALLDLLD